MKTIILSGGRGFRLKEETDFKPKPMVNVGGKPILWHIMKIYETWGFNDFIIALGYKGEFIKEYFLNQKNFTHNFTLYTKSGRTKIFKDHELDGKQDDFKITFVDSGLESLTGERVRRLKDFIGPERFMVTYGDGVGNINIKELVKFHQQRKVIGTITGVHARSKWGQVITDKNRMAIYFKQKPVFDEYVNGGFMIFEPEFFNYLKPNEMIELVLERLVKKKELAVYVHEGFWQAMDTYQDMKDLNEIWEKKTPWKMWK